MKGAAVSKNAADTAVLGFGAVFSHSRASSHSQGCLMPIVATQACGIPVKPDYCQTDSHLQFPSYWQWNLTGRGMDGLTQWVLTCEMHDSAAWE